MRWDRKHAYGLAALLACCGALWVGHWLRVSRAQEAPASTNLQPIPRAERKADAPAINQPLGRDPKAARPAAPPFLIGVWHPPANSLAVWKARGLNLVVGYEPESGAVSIDDWTNAATSAELFMIRQPRVVRQDDLDEPFLIGWLQMDEPDVHNAEPAVLQNAYQLWKKDAPNLPIFVNVSGGNVLFKKTPRVVYEQYFQAADWIGNDFYPVTGWGQPTWLQRVGQAVDACRELSKGKPQFAFIETSNQNLAWTPPGTRGPTRDEVRAEIWDAVIHGVKGIVYFPQAFNPFKFDATPTDVSLEITRQHRALEAIGPALATPPNPAGMSVAVDPPLEATWRKTEQGAVYVIVLNLSKEAQGAQAVRLTGFPTGKAQVVREGDRTVSFTPHGFTDDFLPYGVHVYTLGGTAPAPR